MNKKFTLIVFVLLAVVLLSNCGSGGRVGALQSESQSVELEDASNVRAVIEFGAGDLEISGEAEELLEADFTYNVAKLKPQVKYKDGRLVVRQPDTHGMPDLRGLLDFRNEWDLRFSNQVPLDLAVNIGGGDSQLRLSSLPLTRLAVKLGAGASTIDLNGDWTSDLSASIDAGAANLTVLLPSNVGVRVEVDRGPTIIEAPGLEKNGNIYTNAAYGKSEVTLRLDLTTGIGWTVLQVEEADEAAATD